MATSKGIPQFRTCQNTGNLRYGQPLRNMIPSDYRLTRFIYHSRNTGVSTAKPTSATRSSRSKNTTLHLDTKATSNAFFETFTGAMSVMNAKNNGQKMRLNG
jgi:hypothetical protein